MESERREHVAVVALLRHRPQGLTWSEITGRMLDCGSAVRLWDELSGGHALLADPASSEALENAAAEVRRWTESGVSLHSVLDNDYPARLRSVHQAPALLFSRGALLSDDCAVSVVGNRRASPEGLKRSASIAQALVDEGITVLSGLAEGIDTAAHTAALDRGSRTVAVIGTGIQKYFPTQNRALQDRIAERGLVLSQFWPGASGSRSTFPLRNATMSGYGMATVVVEAGETSGARIQARVAVEHGRPVILTDLVVQRNAWAAELMGRPGVHQARSLADVMHSIRAIAQNRDRVRAGQPA